MGAHQNRDENTGAWSWDPFEWNDPIFSSDGFNDAAYWNGYEQAYGDVYGWDSFSEPGKPGACYYSESRRFFNWGYQDASNGRDVYSIDKAVNWLNENAHSSWKDAEGKCAKYIRWSLEAGFDLEKDAFFGKTSVPARQYGCFLESKGFQLVNTINYLKGDIAVIQGYPGGTRDANGIPYGHIQMYNGNIWISDFKQLIDFWPGRGYRTNQPPFVIYRWIN